MAHALSTGHPLDWRAAYAEWKAELMLTCDYNGWNDAPEEEREWFDMHPEIWNDSVPLRGVRPLRTTPRPPASDVRSGLAA